MSRLLALTALAVAFGVSAQSLSQQCTSALTTIAISPTEVDRGNAPRSALSTSRTSWWSVGPSPARLRSGDPGERPLRTDSRGGFGRPHGRDVLGPTPVYRHRERAGRSAPLRGLRVAPGESREAAEEVGPRRGKKPMEGTSDSMPERVSNATDPFAEQHLEVEGLSRTVLLPQTGNGKRGARPPEGAPTARRDRPW
jgi:hypothetical protein